MPVKLIRERSGKTVTLLERRADKNGNFTLQHTKLALGGEYKLFVEFKKDNVVYQGSVTKEVPGSRDFDTNWIFKWETNIICNVFIEEQEILEENLTNYLLKKTVPLQKKRSSKTRKTAKVISGDYAKLVSDFSTDKPVFLKNYKRINASETKKAKAGGVDNILFLDGIPIPDEFLFESRARVQRTYHKTRWCPQFGFGFRKGKERDYHHTTKNNIHFDVPQCRRRTRTFDLVDYTVGSKDFQMHIFHSKRKLYEPVPVYSVIYTYSKPVLVYEKEWVKVSIIRRGDKLFVFLDERPVREISYPRRLGYFSSSVAYMDVEFEDMAIYPLKGRLKGKIIPTVKIILRKIDKKMIELKKSENFQDSKILFEMIVSWTKFIYKKDPKEALKTGEKLADFYARHPERNALEDMGIGILLKSISKEKLEATKASNKNKEKESIIHTVDSGDTLGSIARQYTGDANNWSIIADYNSINDPASIEVGQIIYIPELILVDQ